jgi:outer membrane receptor protein involved in Fe transport
VSLFFSRQIDDGYRLNDYRQPVQFPHEDARGLLLNRFNHAHIRTRIPATCGTIPVLAKRRFRAYHPAQNHRERQHQVHALLPERAIYQHPVCPIISSSPSKRWWYHNDWGFQQSGDPERTESLSDGVRLEVLSTLLPGGPHTLTFGAEGNFDRIAGDMFGERQIGGLAIFAQDEVKILDDLTLTAGARFDLQSVGLTGEGGQVNPKVALLYRAAPGTSLRASFGEGFRVPSLPEAFVEAGSTGTSGGPEQGPETRAEQVIRSRHRAIGGGGRIDRYRVIPFGHRRPYRTRGCFRRGPGSRSSGGM